MHNGFDPTRHSPHHQFGVREALRLRGVPLGQLQRAHDLALQRPGRLQPAAPSVIGEHGVADVGALLRSQLALGLERFPQYRIGWVLAVRRADDPFSELQGKRIHVGLDAQLSLISAEENHR